MFPTRSIKHPRLVGSRFPRAKTFGSTSLSDGLSFSMASIALSTSLPMVGSFALDCRYDQRAISGTKKTFSALYSSLSSGSAPAYSPVPFFSLVCKASKASEMYLRKIKPRTMCLYSAASIFLRSLSAAFQSCFSIGSSFMLFSLLFTIFISSHWKLFKNEEPLYPQKTGFLPLTTQGAKNPLQKIRCLIF